jgi:hypothetical protein
MELLILALSFIAGYGAGRAHQVLTAALKSKPGQDEGGGGGGPVEPPKP